MTITAKRIRELRSEKAELEADTASLNRHVPSGHRR